MNDDSGDGGEGYPRARLLARLVAVVGLAGLVAVALAAIVDGVLRAFFNAPIDGVGEVSRLVVAISLVSFFPLALTERHNIAIRFLGNAMGTRATRWLDGFGAVLTLCFVAILTWRIIVYALDAREAGETTWMLRWPVGPWWIVAASILALSVPIQAVVLWWFLRGGGRPSGGRDGDA